MTYYVGLDVLLKEVAICVIDGKGKTVREGAVPSEPDDIANWLEPYRGACKQVGLEIGGISRWLHGELARRGFETVCIDPRRLRAITKTGAVKTDRGDALAIAQVLRADWYRPIHIKSDRSQKLTMLLTNRRQLIEKRIALDNAVRGTLRVFGIKLTGRITEAQFEERTRELLANEPELASMVEPMLIARSALRTQAAALHKVLLKVAREDPVCRLLMTTPGVGPLVAVTYMTTIDDPSRFKRSREVGAHLGMTPRKYASGEVDRNGSISKHGDRYLRTSLCQAAGALMTRTKSWCALKA
jgi:transposase